MQAKLVRITPKFYTQRLEATKDFYTEILGFKCLSWEPTWGWSLFGRNQVEIMYTLPNSHIDFKEPVFSGSVYIYIDNHIESIWLELNSKTTVAYPLKDFDYGMKEFAIYDNNGDMLQFGQELASVK